MPRLLPVLFVCFAGASLMADADRTLVDQSFDLPDDTLPEGWWVEGGQAVAVRDGRLWVKANPEPGQPGQVCTVWCPTRLPANVRMDVEARVLASRGEANNINLFLHYADPTGTPLSATRDRRADGAYAKYHGLDGYIVTFLNDFAGEGGRHDDGTTKARYRLRRCPGFRLVDEKFGDRCAAGMTYRLSVTLLEGHLTVAVDDVIKLVWLDPEPLPGGLLGLRTYQTELWWDNLKITALGE